MVQGSFNFTHTWTTLPVVQAILNPIVPILNSHLFHLLHVLYMDAFMHVCVFYEGFKVWFLLMLRDFVDFCDLFTCFVR